MVERKVVLNVETKMILLLGGSVLLSLLLLFHGFIFGDSLYMYQDIGADTAYSYYPNILYLNQRFHNGDFSLWAPEIGLGSGLLSSALLVLDPFNWLLMIIPRQLVDSALVYVAILKLLGCALIGYALARRLRCDCFASYICGIAIALNGYGLILGQHYFFLTGYFFTLLLLWAIEKTVQQKGIFWLLLSVALFSLSTFYYFYMASLFAGVYVAIRLYLRPREEGPVLPIMGKLFIGGLLGLCLAAQALFPVFSVLRGSPRLGRSDWFEHLTPMDPQILWTYLVRLFSPNAMGIGSDYKGPINYYESPLIFVALPVVVFSISYLVHLIRSRPKIVVPLIILFCIGWYCELFSVAFNGFQYRMYRWTHLLSLTLCLLGARGLTLARKDWPSFSIINFYVALIVTSGLLCLIYFRHLLPIPVLIVQELWIAVGIAILLLGLIVRSDFEKQRSLIVILVLLSVMPSLYDATNRVGVMSRKGGRVTERIQGPVDSIKKIDSGIYRIHNDQFASYTESLEFNYLGLPSYSSLTEKGYVEFGKSLNFLSGGLNIVAGPPSSRPILLWLLGVKYFFVGNAQTQVEGFRRFDAAHSPNIYINELPTSLGYVFSNVVSEERFRSLLACLGDNALKLAVAYEGLEIDEDLGPSERGLCEKWKSVVFTTPDLLEIQSYGRGLFSAQYNNTSGADRYVLISIPFNEGWAVTVNGKEAQTWRANFGLTGVRIGPGLNKIEFTFSQPGAVAGRFISLIGVVFLGLFSCSKLCLGNKISPVF